MRPSRSDSTSEERLGALRVGPVWVAGASDDESWLERLLLLKTAQAGMKKPQGTESVEAVWGMGLAECSELKRCRQTFQSWA
jgi:hypothetical protein